MIDADSVPPMDDDQTVAETSWKAVDLEAVLSGDWHPPQPTVGTRTDGVGLFYPGKVHWVSSETEAGKTWLALAVCAHELHAGNHVVYIDFEDDENAIVGRMLAMQLDANSIREYFHYHRPFEAMTMKGGEPYDELAASLALHPTLAVIDGVAEAMATQQLEPKDNSDIARFQQILPRMIAASGAAVVCLDHVVKDKDGRGRYAIGGVHKINGIDGAALVLESRHPIGDNLKGRSYIRIAKDRPGQLRKHAAPGKPMFWLGDLIVDLTLDGLADGVVTVEPPAGGRVDQRPTTVMKRVSDVLASHPDGLAQRTIQSVVQGKTETIRLALDHLIADGYVTAKTPHKLIRPFVSEGESDDDDQ